MEHQIRAAAAATVKEILVSVGTPRSSVIRFRRLGSPWLCGTVHEIDAGALTFGCLPAANASTRIFAYFWGSAGGIRALVR
jgi:hypothetical protein